MVRGRFLTKLNSLPDTSGTPGAQFLCSGAASAPWRPSHAGARMLHEVLFQSLLVQSLPSQHGGPGQCPSILPDSQSNRQFQTTRAREWVVLVGRLRSLC